MEVFNIKEMRRLMDEFANINEAVKADEELNEISTETLRSAIDKLSERGSRRRINSMGRTFFREFMGREFMGGTITDIVTDQSPHYASGDLHVIIVWSDHRGKDRYVYYDVENDLYENYDISGGPSSEDIALRDARTLSLVAKKINPQTKYDKTRGNFKIKEDN